MLRNGDSATPSQLESWPAFDLVRATTVDAVCYPAETLRAVERELHRRQLGDGVIAGLQVEVQKWVGVKGWLALFLFGLFASAAAYLYLAYLLVQTATPNSFWMTVRPGVTLPVSSAPMKMPNR